MTETKPKHTPGPWTVRREGDSFQGDYCITNYSKTVLIGDMIYSGRRSSICEANARLIAAAPELLESLKKVVDWWSNSHAEFGEASRELWNSSFEPMQAARAAIAKAKGETES